MTAETMEAVAWWVCWISGALVMGGVLLVPFLPDRKRARR